MQADTGLSAQQVAECREAFDLFDTDGSGSMPPRNSRVPTRYKSVLSGKETKVNSKKRVHVCRVGMDLPFYDSNDRYIDWVQHLPQSHFEALHHAVLHRLRTPLSNPPSPGRSPPALPSTLIQALVECATPIVDPHGAHAEEMAPVTPGYSLVSTGEALHSTALYRAVIERFEWLGEVKGPVYTVKGAVDAALYCYGSSSDACYRRLGEIDPPAHPRGSRQWVNKLPGVAEACKKAHLHRAFARCRPFRRFPFVPEAWVLPIEMDACAAALSADSGWCIVKPASASPNLHQAGELWLADTWKSISQKMFANGVDSSKLQMVQRYIEEPLLLTGCRKFHVTLFALVVNCRKQWQLSVCKEGLVTACAIAYRQPTGNNMSCQLTGSTRGSNPTTHALSSLLPQIAAAAGIDQDRLTGRLRAVCSETVSVMTPILDAAWHRAEQHCGHSIEADAFHIISVELLLNEQGEPKLIEVNANPSMAMYDKQGPEDTPNATETAVKVAVLEGALEIVLGVGHSARYQSMPLTRVGVWDQLCTVFCDMTGPTKEITGPMFRKLMQQSGAATQLVSDDVFRTISGALNDRKFGVVQGSPPGVMCSTNGGCRYKGVGVEVFFDLITELVNKYHEDEPTADALEFICDLFDGLH